MATTQNLLLQADQAHAFDTAGNRVSTTGYTNAWQTSSNATITINDSVVQDLNYYTIVVSPSNTNSCSLYLPSTAVPSKGHGGSFLQFHCLFNCSVPATTTTSLKETGQPQPANYPAKSILGVKGQYTVARSNLFAFPADLIDRYFNITMDFSGHEGNSIYVTVPCLINDHGFMRNTMVKNAFGAMPDVYFDKDSTQEDPSFPMFKLYDAMTDRANEVMLTYSLWRDLELDEIGPGKTGEENWATSQLTTPAQVADANIDWLAQFTGKQMRNNVQGKDSSGTAREYFSAATDIKDYLTWQLLYSYYGRAAGTRDAMVQAAKQVLTGTKGVGVIPNYLSDPWKIQIQTLQAETVYDSSNSNISEDVLVSVEPTRPLGYQIYHAAVAQFVFIVGNVGLGILGQGQLA
jgi:hypothetical protein